MPFVRAHRTVAPWTPRNDGVYTSQAPTMARHAVNKAPAKTHKNRNARLDDLRSAVLKQIAYYTASDANWLNTNLKKIKQIKLTYLSDKAHCFVYGPNKQFSLVWCQRSFKSLQESNSFWCVLFVKYYLQPFIPTQKISVQVINIHCKTSSWINCEVIFNLE